MEKKQHTLSVKKGKIHSLRVTLALNADLRQMTAYFGGSRQTHRAQCDVCPTVSLAPFLGSKQSRVSVHRINDRGHGLMNLCQHEKSMMLQSAETLWMS